MPQPVRDVVADAGDLQGQFEIAGDVVDPIGELGDGREVGIRSDRERKRVGEASGDAQHPISASREDDPRNRVDAGAHRGERRFDLGHPLAWCAP